MNANSSSQIALWDMPAATAAGRAEGTMIRELPETEQPSNRLNFVGPSAMTDSELLTLVGSFTHVETAAALLARAGTLGRLAQMSVAELKETKGVTTKAAEAIRATLELGRRVAAAPRDGGRALTSAWAVFDYASHLQHLEVEHMCVILCNTHMHPISMETVHIGDIASCSVALNQVFKEAVRKNAHGIILLHNHPSGDPTPSAADISLTKHAIEAGRLLGIQVHDHVVIGHGRFTSLRDEGLNKF